MLQLKLTGDEQAQTAGRRTDLRDIRYPADAALVLGVVLGAGEGIRHAGGAAVDRGEGGGTDVELGEGVEVNVDLVLRVAFALGFDLLGLFCIVSMGIKMVELGDLT